MTLTPSGVLDYLQERRISVWAVARRLETDATHLRRVLTGQRKGSQALLQAVMDAAETMQGRRVHRTGDEVDHLIDAAAHMFFLQRGDFESAIFVDPDEMHTGLYGPGPRKGRTRGPRDLRTRKRIELRISKNHQSSTNQT